MRRELFTVGRDTAIVASTCRDHVDLCAQHPAREVWTRTVIMEPFCKGGAGVQEGSRALPDSTPSLMLSRKRRNSWQLLPSVAACWASVGGETEARPGSALDTRQVRFAVALL